MAETVGRYKVRYEWDPAGAWVITVPDVPGCRTEAKTLEEGQRLIRDALSLFVDDAQTAILVNLVVPPPGLTRAVKRAEAAEREISRNLAKDLRVSSKDANRLLAGARYGDKPAIHGKDAKTGSFVVVDPSKHKTMKTGSGSKPKARSRTRARPGR